MLRVTIEVVPFSDPKNVQTLHVMEIWNDGGKRDDTHGNYKSRAFAKRLKSGPPVRTGQVLNFPRARKNAWHLLARMLKNMGYN